MPIVLNIIGKDTVQELIDFDVHHGNGTQKVFNDSDAVFFVSLHQSPAYPGTGMADEKGGGVGYGYNLNIPMGVNAGDSDYLEDPLASVSLTGYGNHYGV